ncbi:MAG: BCCT family transporter, partial [Halobacteriota archaeon]
ILGPTLFLLGLVPQGIGVYLQNFFQFSMHSEAIGGLQVYESWTSYWTIFYWAWWIAWSPFVGMFIARISRGRTVREFMIGVLVLPVLFSFFWFAILGGTAIDMELNAEGTDPANVGFATVLAEDGGSPVAMFEMFDNMALTVPLSILAVVLVATFFVTSSDSGSLVIDHLTSGGKHDAPVTMRIFWAVTEGVVAAVLLWVGGDAALNALQAAAISAGLPFVIVLIFMAFATYIGLRNEYEILQSEEFLEAIDMMGDTDEGVVIRREGGAVVTQVESDDSGD